MLPRLLPAAALSFAIHAGHSEARAQEVHAPQEPASANPSDATPVFDVAAIHPHISQPHEHNSIWSSTSDGHFKAENISVLSLLHWAYEMPETRILGAPAWAAEAHFNIEASADPALDLQLKTINSDAGRKLKEKMVQAMLADRFQFAAHFETRELPIYDLVVAKGGPRLGPVRSDGTTISTSNGHIAVQAPNSVAVFAEELSKVVGRNVVDKTGLSGRYDIKLTWTPDDRLASSPGGPASSGDSGPSLFAALDEQLGLKLEPQKGPVTVLVIDHIELPSQN
jgi:uncharacterized protein (TIGR03435 family)